MIMKYVDMFTQMILTVVQVIFTRGYWWLVNEKKFMYLLHAVKLYWQISFLYIMQQSQTSVWTYEKM